MLPYNLKEEDVVMEKYDHTFPPRIFKEETKRYQSYQAMKKYNGQGCIVFSEFKNEGVSNVHDKKVHDGLRDGKCPPQINRKIMKFYVSIDTWLEAGNSLP